jgi:predicted ATP-dependent endonuclease of OLD family
VHIQNIRIRNFRSLRDVELKGLGNLIVIVGKNSSGKSNLLEALSIFFSDFSVIGGNTPGLDEYYWFNKKTEDSVEFELNISLSEEELGKIFGAKLLEDLRSYPDTFSTMLEIKRRMNKQGTWETTDLECSGVSIVKDNKPADSKEVFRKFNPEKTAAKDDIVFGLTAPSTNEINNIITAISTLVGRKFELISQIRDVQNPIARRVTLVDSKIQSALWTLDQSIKSDEEEKFQSIEGSFTNVTGKQLDPAQGQVYIRRQQRRFPLYLEGGGIQASIQLVFELKNEMDKYSVFGVEEPEAHLHSELQRKLFDELKCLSTDCQLFITTHSPTFVDRADLDTVWISRFTNGETTFEKAAELTEILGELGIKPSDVLFFANKILFVEGKTEEIVIPAFAQKLQVDLGDIAIIAVEGKTKARLNLKTWLKITRGILPMFLLLDKDAEAEIGELEKENLIKRGTFHVWRLGSIESYYPLPLLKKALTELDERYHMEMDVNAIVNEIKTGKLPPDKIDIGEEKDRLLDKKWKVLLAESVANLIREEKQVGIDDEVKTVLNEAIGT